MFPVATTTVGYTITTCTPFAIAASTAYYCVGTTTQTQLIQSTFATNSQPLISNASNFLIGILIFFSVLHFVLCLPDFIRK